MKFDFSSCVNASAEDVYPPLYMQAYADLKDILSINDAIDLMEFVDGTRGESMKTDIIGMFPHMDRKCEDRLKTFVVKVIDDTRTRTHDELRNMVSGRNHRLDDEDVYAIIKDLQVHMMAVSAWIAEGIVSSQDPRIDKDNCRPGL